MTLEETLVAALKTVTPKVYPDVAPAGAAVPYLTYQQIGGKAIAYLDGSLPDKECAWVQISVWSATREEAKRLILAAETKICATMQASPQGASIAAYSEDSGRRGAHQDFEIWAAR